MSFPLSHLALRFLSLSLLAVGGAQALVPQIQLEFVTQTHWISPHEFTELFALSQLLPGPNLLVMIGLIGWHVAEAPGFLVAILAVMGPSSVLAWGVGRFYASFAHIPSLLRLKMSLAPVVVGLTFSSGWILVQTITTDKTGWFVAGFVALVGGLTSLHPTLILGMGTCLALILFSLFS